MIIKHEGTYLDALFPLAFHNIQKAKKAIKAFLKSIFLFLSKHHCLSPISFHRLKFQHN